MLAALPTLVTEGLPLLRQSQSRSRWLQRPRQQKASAEWSRLEIVDHQHHGTLVLLPLVYAALLTQLLVTVGLQARQATPAQPVNNTTVGVGRGWVGE